MNANQNMLSLSGEEYSRTGRIPSSGVRMDRGQVPRSTRLSLGELLVMSHPRWFRPNWRRWQWFERVAQVVAAILFAIFSLIWVAQFFHLFG